MIFCTYFIIAYGVHFKSMHELRSRKELACRWRKPKEEVPAKGKRLNISKIVKFDKF